MKNLSLTLLTILITGISCTGGSDDKNSGKRGQQYPIRVTTEVVSATSSDNTQTYVGIVEENEATAVSFTSMGVVKRVLVSEGQPVGKGQLIAEMDDTQARNLLEGAEAQLKQANDALERYGMLHENGSLPEVKWVEIQTKVTQAKSQVEVARKNLADCQLKAPVGGIVGRKRVVAGETAMPSQAVVTILDINKVKVKVAIPEAEVSHISTHTPSTIKVDAIGKQFEGGQIEKGVQADALTHTYDVRILVANTARQLLPGMVASVSFVSDTAVSAEAEPLTLPVTTVQRRANGNLFVWMVDKDNNAHRADVTIGETQGNRVVITSGIGTGQRIVTEGYQKLSEGTKVVF